ncbi:MAG: Gfo/Idh/MocA family oxidoreductase [Sphingobium sp.]|nr:Gfo/Idh/MocA family oxidoreductase [Sphingobium sp.]
MRKIAMIGTGFVADYYAASLRTFPDIDLVACFDRDTARLHRFCAHWNLPAVESFEALLASEATLVLNLTNPHEHFATSAAALRAGKHVYSEKPLATDLAEATTLHALAVELGLQIASAPCSLLGQSAQTLREAIETGAVGTPRLVYAELDDDYISQAPVAKWMSASGAPWPIRDELKVGCTLEHAGYYLTWLMDMFGPVATVVSASARVGEVDHLIDESPAPDYSSATLFFESGMVARLTCSIIAPHDHRLRVFGERGVAEIAQAWNNQAPVKLRSRFVIRRRLMNSPIAAKAKPGAWTTHPFVDRKQSAMNFMLGPAEMLDAIAVGRPAKLGGDFALHLTEVTLAVQNAGSTSGAQAMTTRFRRTAPVRWSGTRTEA